MNKYLLLTICLVACRANVNPPADWRDKAVIKWSNDMGENEPRYNCSTDYEHDAICAVIVKGQMHKLWCRWFSETGASCELLLPR